MSQLAQQLPDQYLASNSAVSLISSKSSQRGSTQNRFKNFMTLHTDQNMPSKLSCPPIDTLIGYAKVERAWYAKIHHGVGVFIYVETSLHHDIVSKCLSLADSS